MAKLICEICGGDTLLKEGEQFRCNRCGACYSSEQLKKMLEVPAVEATDVLRPEETPAPQPEVPAPAEASKEHENQSTDKAIKKVKRKTIIAIVVVAVFLLGVLALIFGSILFSFGLLPDKSRAKKLTEGHLEHKVSNEDITLTDVQFDSVEVIKFYTREEDPVGYFAFMDQPVTVVEQDGNETEYEDYFERIREKHDANYDPEADLKRAYIMTGTYEVNHKVYDDVSGEFYIIYVHNLTENCWYPVKSEYGVSEDVLRQDVYNHVMAYLLLTYDIQPNPEIKITSIEKDKKSYYGYDYMVYGTVSVRDHYDEQYDGKFVAQYTYDNHDQHFEKESLEIEPLSKNPLLDIFRD